jgi:hypothetical protein
MSKSEAAATKKIQSAKKVYSDGHPHDVIQNLEAKLILKPDRFTSVGSFREFGEIVARTTKQIEKEDFIPDVKQVSGRTSRK